MEAVDGVFWEEVFDGVFAFQSEYFAVGEAGAMGFAGDFFDAT